MQSWAQRQEVLQRLARRQLFFVGGAPRSGTTWLQRLLDSHPEICCRSEGLFMAHLAKPLEHAMAERRQALEAKNSQVFRDTGGFALPDADDTEMLIGTAILLALERQCAGTNYKAIGEKTPENVFFFARLKRLFPQAKLIAIARDPRDVLSSAWHFFHKQTSGEDEAAAKFAFIRLALPSLQEGARTTLALMRQYPSDCVVVTYERMRTAPELIARQLFRFLGVADDDALIAAGVAKTSFTALSGGRQAGVVQDGSFFRSGVVGDWPATFTPDMNALILQELGWMFPDFGWQP